MQWEVGVMFIYHSRYFSGALFPAIPGPSGSTASQGTEAIDKEPDYIETIAISIRYFTGSILSEFISDQFTIYSKHHYLHELSVM